MNTSTKVLLVFQKKCSDRDNDLRLLQWWPATVHTRSQVFAMDTLGRRVSAGCGAGRPLPLPALQPLSQRRSIPSTPLLSSSPSSGSPRFAAGLPRPRPSCHQRRHNVLDQVLPRNQGPAGELHWAHSRAPCSTGWQPILRLEALAHRVVWLQRLREGQVTHGSAPGRRWYPPLHAARQDEGADAPRRTRPASSGMPRLPPDIRMHCVPFVGVETLANVARCADAQFRAWPRPAVPPQVCSVPRGHVEYGDEIITAVQD